MTDADLPQKTREHILESANERLFRFVLPDAWDDTKPSRDYGIDLKVEIFELRGTGAVPTGLEFGVQLKATDAEDRRADRVGIDRATLEYWRLHAYPVLVVRYKAATKELFGRWAHNRPTGPEPGRPTVQAWFKFGTDDLLVKDGDCWERISAEVTAFRRVFERRIGLPLRLGFVGSRATASLETRWNAELASVVGRNQIVLDRTVTIPPRLVCEIAMIGVDPGGPNGVFFHDSETVTIPTDTATVLLALTLALGRCLAFGDVAHTAPGAIESPLLADPDTLTRFTSMLVAADRTDLALAAIRRWGDPTSQLTTVIVATAILRTHNPAAAFDELRATQQWMIDSASPGNDRAAQLFNAATALASVGDRVGALARYEECAREPGADYDERSYFWRFYGGSRILAGDFEGGFQAYSAANSYGEDDDAFIVAWGESALFTGRYEECSRMVGEQLGPGPHAGRRILSLVAQSVRAWANVEVQERKPSEAQALYESLVNDHGTLTDDDVLSLVELDALYPATWAAIVDIAVGLGLPEPAGLALLTYTYLARTDPYAWARTIVTFSSGTPDHDTLVELLRQARIDAGPEVDVELVNLADDLEANDLDSVAQGTPERIRALLRTPTSEHGLALMDRGSVRVVIPRQMDLDER